ncbi:putative Late nodulin [Medicago truncatula]|uniref:Nodule Cysteine-Rich (NCR) secreted peptide n=1 Tax=Medicago truncatula TaxID=3880 RepID=G7L4Z6_MEDTR|nr:Nodule Cysteine-Rich (NCR) secreted peptide [Medicago truncatula]RHN48577.1 putative Late nodulin [Medicago truncatula]
MIPPRANVYAMIIFLFIFFVAMLVKVSHSHCVIDAHCPRNMCGFHFPPRCVEGDCVC